MNILYMSLGPSEYCSSPPVVENADVGYNNKIPIGEFIVYACKTGFKPENDGVRLECVLSKNYTSLWTGDHVECVSTNQGNRCRFKYKQSGFLNIPVPFNPTFFAGSIFFSLKIKVF